MPSHLTTRWRPSRCAAGTRPTLRGGGLRTLTVAATAGGVMLVGLPATAETTTGTTTAEPSAGATPGATPGAGGRVAAGPRFRAPALAASSPALAGQASTALPSSHRTRKPRRISPDVRRIVRYTVRPGDTPSGLAVRFHAWTAELIAMNGSVLRVGERIRIPVVVAAVVRERRERARRAAARAQHSRATKAARAPRQRAEKRRAQHRREQHRTRAQRARVRAAARPTRTEVRQVIASTAHRHGVDPQLALAVAWQESGWQMHVVSSAGAIGAMQVMPATGRWMSDMVGRRLHLRDLRDNATAGVVLLRWLDGQARRRVAIAGYYQGLAGVRSHGMYSDTRRYVANVLALKRQFERGHYPV